MDAGDRAMRLDKRLPNFDVESVRTFFVVAEVGNFGDASEILHKTPAAVSYRIRTLEAQFGRQLFFRTKHSLEITPSGLRLLHLLRDAYSFLEKIPQEFDLIDGEEVEHFKLSFGRVIDDVFSSKLARVLTEKFPGTSFSFGCADADSVSRRLEPCDFDCYVGELSSPLDDEARRSILLGGVGWAWLNADSGDDGGLLWVLKGGEPLAVKDLQCVNRRMMVADRIQLIEAQFEFNVNSKALVPFSSGMRMAENFGCRLEKLQASKTSSCFITHSLSRAVNISDFIIGYCSTNLVELGIVE